MLLLQQVRTQPVQSAYAHLLAPIRRPLAIRSRSFSEALHHCSRFDCSQCSTARLSISSPLSSATYLRSDRYVIIHVDCTSVRLDCSWSSSARSSTSLPPVRSNSQFDTGMPAVNLDCGRLSNALVHLLAFIKRPLAIKTRLSSKVLRLLLLQQMRLQPAQQRAFLFFFLARCWAPPVVRTWSIQETTTNARCIRSVRLDCNEFSSVPSSTSTRRATPPDRNHMNSANPMPAYRSSSACTWPLPPLFSASCLWGGNGSVNCGPSGLDAHSTQYAHLPHQPRCTTALIAAA